MTAAGGWWPLDTNVIEGINNKIKVINRMAYGFRGHAYFFLKIRSTFPGVRRRTKKAGAEAPEVADTPKKSGYFGSLV